MSDTGAVEVTPIQNLIFLPDTRMCVTVSYIMDDFVDGLSSCRKTIRFTVSIQANEGMVVKIEMTTCKTFVFVK